MVGWADEIPWRSKLCPLEYGGQCGYQMRQEQNCPYIHVQLHAIHFTTRVIDGWMMDPNVVVADVHLFLICSHAMHKWEET